jgi:hypothetical protein
VTKNKMLSNPSNFNKDGAFLKKHTKVAVLRRGDALALWTLGVGVVKTIRNAFTESAT